MNMIKQLTDFSDYELSEELRKRKEERKLEHMVPVGRWHVTTEGDCEGKSTTDLGIHEGHIVDIAFKLSERSYYKLRFEKAIEEKKLEERDSVCIGLGIETGTWDMNPEDRAKAIESMLRKEDAHRIFKVETGQYYSSVTLKK